MAMELVESFKLEME